MNTTSLFAFGVLLSTLGGCAAKYANNPTAPLQFADADYEITTDFSQEVCNAYLFGIDFSGLFSKRGANLPAGGGFNPFGPKELSEAMYDVNESLGEATHVISARTQTTVKGVSLGPALLFGERCGTVSGVAAKVKGPLPRQ